MDMDYKAIGKRVRAMRKARGYTQEQLAERADISFPFVGHIERGTRVMSIKTLDSLARALDCSADYLLGNAQEDSKDYLLALQRVADFIEEEIRNVSQRED